MKKNHLITAGLLCFTISVKAQQTSNTATNTAAPVSNILKSPSIDGRDVLADYSAARRKIDSEPKITKLKAAATAAQEAYRNAFEAALAKENPKMFSLYKTFRTRAPLFAQHRYPLPAQTGGGYSNLNEQERKELDEARQAAIDLPGIKELREKRNDATSEAVRIEAEREYKAAMQKEMIHNDKNIQIILNKMNGNNAATEATPSPFGATIQNKTKAP